MTDRRIPETAREITFKDRPHDEFGFVAKEQFTCRTVSHYAVLELIRVISTSVSPDKKHRIILDFDPDAEFCTVTCFQQEPGDK